MSGATAAAAPKDGAGTVGYRVMPGVPAPNKIHLPPDAP